LQFTHDEVQHLPSVLSSPRFATYLIEKNSDKEQALALYQWNLELSSAFIIPLQICEVGVRNSIVTAIENAYGQNWPWAKSFEIALRNPPRSYSPRRDLTNLRKLATTGKIVAELRFIFWEKMLTKGHDGAIWNNHLRTAFPHADQLKTIQELRTEGNEELRKIRELRNRIAHHEPIFRRNIQDEYDRIKKVINWSNPTAALWVDKIEKVTRLITTKP
tara:strand:+ start:718 stop:1371 length:654 start_codon:yes stop_codon:yes gene_type:complete